MWRNKCILIPNCVEKGQWNINSCVFKAYLGTFKTGKIVKLKCANQS